MTFGVAKAHYCTVWNFRSSVGWGVLISSCMSLWIMTDVFLFWAGAFALQNREEVTMCANILSVTSAGESLAISNTTCDVHLRTRYSSTVGLCICIHQVLHWHRQWVSRQWGSQPYDSSCASLRTIHHTYHQVRLIIRIITYDPSCVSSGTIHHPYHQVRLMIRIIR
jgi:hypothetical protein